MTQLRLSNDRPMKLRKLIEIGTQSSLGIVIPKSMVKMMNLRLGDFMACEMNEDGSGLLLNKCSLTAEPVGGADAIIIEETGEDDD